MPFIVNELSKHAVERPSMLMDETTQNLPKVAMSLNSDLTAETLSKFSSEAGAQGRLKKASRRVPLWLQTALPFVCVAAAVLLLGFSTQNWIVAGITGAAGFISLSAFFAFAAYHRVKGQELLKKDLLIAAVEAKTRPVAITDLNGALVCANSAYGRLLSGFPSPNSLPESDEERNALLEASRSARVCGRGETQVQRRTKDGAQPLDVTIRRSKQIENYLVWDVEGAGQEAQIQRFFDLYESGLGHWLEQVDAGVVITEASGSIRTISPHLKAWVGGLDKADKDYALSDIVASPSGFTTLLNGQGQAVCEVQVIARPLGQDRDSAGMVYLLQKRSRTSEVSSKNVDIAQAVFNDAPVGMAVVDTDGDFLRANKAIKSLLRASDRASFDNLYSLFAGDNLAAVRRYIAAAAKAERVQETLEARLDGDDDAVIRISTHVLDDQKGEVLLFVSDATEQKSLERQFAQAQKMQAVGQLAGGIAHDFNNILTAIIGFSDLLLVRHSAGDPSFADIMQVKQNANRAANLVRQLLAFSRQQTLMPKVLDITDVLAELSNLIRRLIGENITLNMVHGRDLGQLLVDQGQLEQVIVNLAVNARDAMDGGGDLTITTSMETADEVSRLGHDFMPNQDYIRLAVSDTGHGIEKENLNKIFEPFFTTKETGKGTGLGLSTVYGIVKQTGGFIFAESQPGQGATFIIYLPVHVQTEDTAETATASVDNEPPAVADYWGRGTIMLVEDEDAVRTFASRALAKKGYHVVAASSGQEALDLLNDDLAIDLLITDVVMPQMDGPTLVQTVRQSRPELQVIFISGYAQDGIGVAEGLDKIEFLPKPFSLSQLAEAVKAAMPAAPEMDDTPSETA
ncbi:MAG: ATP-binding protein [Pseudomonadota bacterium]